MARRSLASRSDALRKLKELCVGKTRSEEFEYPEDVFEDQTDEDQTDSDSSSGSGVSDSESSTSADPKASSPPNMLPDYADTCPWTSPVGASCPWPKPSSTGAHVVMADPPRPSCAPAMASASRPLGRQPDLAVQVLSSDDCDDGQMVVDLVSSDDEGQPLDEGQHQDYHKNIKLIKHLAPPPVGPVSPSA